MEDFEKRSDIINALKRLERAGAEDSKASLKLKAAADSLADFVLGEIADWQADLPGGWRKDHEVLVCPDDCTDDLNALDDWTVGNGTATRKAAFVFAKAIADGWLDRLAHWMLGSAVLSDKAREAIERAHGQLGADS